LKWYCIGNLKMWAKYKGSSDGNLQRNLNSW
jgi:hypothetical protein